MTRKRGAHELRNPFACEADQLFTAEVKCPTGGPHFGSTTVRSKTPVKCPVYAPPTPRGGGGGWGGCFGIERYAIKYKEKNLDIPNLIRATIICPLAFRFTVVQLYMH